MYLLHFETKLPVRCKIQFLNAILALSEIAAAPVKRLRGERGGSQRRRAPRRCRRPCTASGAPAAARSPLGWEQVAVLAGLVSPSRRRALCQRRSM